jgi:plastocyanin
LAQRGRHSAHRHLGDPLFKSKALDTDDSFSFTFTEPGTYEYFCSLHPRMTATIVVERDNASK